MYARRKYDAVGPNGLVKLVARRATLCGDVTAQASVLLRLAMQLPQLFDMTAFPDQRAVLKNDHCVFLARPGRRTLPGSGLIVPFAPRETVFDLTPEEWAATFALLHEAKAWIDEHHAPDGYNIGWNNGRVAGQTILQVHLHVIPRFADEPLAGRGIRYYLKQPENLRPDLRTGEP